VNDVNESKVVIGAREGKGTPMPILKVCCHPGCGRLVAPPYKQKLGARCPEHIRADNLRRAPKQQAAGRTTAHWTRLKKQAKEDARYRCQNCGRPEVPNPHGWLSVHLRPDFGGEHRHATLADVVVLCLSCHGSLDAPRAQPRPRNHDGPTRPQDRFSGPPLIA
jgi:hypothetical protein